MNKSVSKHIELKTVQVPASKSYAQRAILAAALSSTKSEIIGQGNSDDVSNIIRIATQIGAEINDYEDKLIIQGYQREMTRDLNVGESGLGIRLTTSIAAVLNGSFSLNGTGSLLNRSMSEFDHFLPQLGISCSSNNGFLPIQLDGNAKPGKISMDGSLSSQYLSGLLMALPLLKGDSEITVSNLKSKPYIDITLDVLKSFGIEIENVNYELFRISGNQTYFLTDKYPVEGDYSAASIWMVLGAINDGITITGLNEKSVQADKMMLEALTNSGIKYEWNQHDLIIHASTPIPFVFDANECPDLFPALVVLAAACKGKSTLKGVNRLTHKESNRGLVLQKEFQKLGLRIDLENDSMHVFGTGALNSGQVHSNNDHRIAMAGAIAAVLTPNGNEIIHAESVNKSYPDFWKALSL